MIETLLVATNNRGKVREIVPLLDGIVRNVICLADLEKRIEVEETEDTFEGNARLKAEALHRLTGNSTLADDSGLVVDALDGAPGVYSARYAGENATDADNNRKLLGELQKITDPAARTARFRCVMALVHGGETHLFDGAVEGRLAFENRGESGFGYDPLFIPDGYDLTFAELGLDVKQQLSHRSRALAKVAGFLKKSSETA